LTEHVLEAAIELRQRLKADIICNFADPPVRIQQSRAGVFEPDTRDVVREL